MPDVVAQRGASTYLVDIGDNLGQVVYLEEKEAFPPFNFQSILARGYWEPVVHLLPTELDEILRLAEDARKIVSDRESI